ncbi:MAG: phosphatase PAP2 family protein [Ilumatobacteraceae bacterium]
MSAASERSERDLPAARPAPSLAERTFPRGPKATAVELLAAYVLLTAIWVGLGLLITGPLNGSSITEVDQDVATWMVDQRTPALDDWSAVGSLLADTLVKIIATAVIAVIMLAIWRSWREPLMISLALVLEASVFITTTWIVARPRPDVEPLDSSPVDSSFPSGHTAAAAAYGAIAVVIFERTRNVWIRTVTVVVMIALPIVVGVARMYRGMHFLTDVVAGTILGVASVVVVYLVFRPARADEPVALTHR